MTDTTVTETISSPENRARDFLRANPEIMGLKKALVWNSLVSRYQAEDAGRAPAPNPHTHANTPTAAELAQLSAAFPKRADETPMQKLARANAMTGEPLARLREFNRCRAALASLAPAERVGSVAETRLKMAVRSAACLGLKLDGEEG